MDRIKYKEKKYTYLEGWQPTVFYKLRSCRFSFHCQHFKSQTMSEFIFWPKTNQQQQTYKSKYYIILLFTIIFLSYFIQSKPNNNQQKNEWLASFSLKVSLKQFTIGAPIFLKNVHQIKSQNDHS